MFKTGAISLVFLVIGYQTALFINRAAILGIEAARDHPDTVYVVRHVLPDDGSGRSGGGDGSVTFVGGVTLFSDWRKPRSS